jgi:hypothetical protein
MTKKQMLIILANDNTIDYTVLLEDLSNDDNMFEYIKDNVCNNAMLLKVQQWIDDNY